MVPILHMGHWTLYVINIQLRCIHILDSNPYGPELGGTSWKMFHYSLKDIGTRKLPWARVIMNRLNKSLQQVRPNSRIPKFGNFPIDMPPMCPTMIAGSNDCGFFVMRYIQYYDHTDGSIKQFIKRVSHFMIMLFVFIHSTFQIQLIHLGIICIMQENSGDLRSLALHYLTFHSKNKCLPLPLEIQRFKFGR